MSLPLRPAKPISDTSPNRFLETRSVAEQMSRVDNIVEGVERAKRAAARRMHARLVRDGERTYRAYSADELIEIDSIAHHGRPGMPY